MQHLPVGPEALTLVDIDKVKHIVLSKAFTPNEEVMLCEFPPAKDIVEKVIDALYESPGMNPLLEFNWHRNKYRKNKIIVLTSTLHTKAALIELVLNDGLESHFKDCGYSHGTKFHSLLMKMLRQIGEINKEIRSDKEEVIFSELDSSSGVDDEGYYVNFYFNFEGDDCTKWLFSTKPLTPNKDNISISRYLGEWIIENEEAHDICRSIIGQVIEETKEKYSHG